MTEDKRSIEELDRMWAEFGDTSCDNDDNIEEAFYDWPAGTYRFDIWQWFDRQYPMGLAAHLGNSMRWTHELKYEPAISQLFEPGEKFGLKKALVTSVIISIRPPILPEGKEEHLSDSYMAPYRLFVFPTEGKWKCFTPSGKEVEGDTPFAAVTAWQRLCSGTVFAWDGLFSGLFYECESCGSISESVNQSVSGVTAIHAKLPWDTEPLSTDTCWLPNEVYATLGTDGEKACCPYCGDELWRYFESKDEFTELEEDTSVPGEEGPDRCAECNEGYRLDVIEDFVYDGKVIPDVHQKICMKCGHIELPEQAIRYVENWLVAQRE